MNVSRRKVLKTGIAAAGATAAGLAARPAEAQLQECPFSVIQLDKATRQRLSQELGLRGDLTKIPDRIVVNRFSRAQLGMERPALASYAWVMEDA